MNASFASMGTVISVAGSPDEATLTQIREVFARWDERFSLYKPDSELSRLARREFPLTKASTELREAYALAQTWRAETEGAFTAHRPDGFIDLSGVVKALAIAEAGEVLRASGLAQWCVNAGGDLLGSGASFVVGIVDPDDRGELLTQFTLSPRHPALATSGVAERGEHVWRIGTWAAEGDPFVQVSVAGPDIVTADVLATAILSGGRATLDRALERWPIEVLAVSRDGQYLATDAFRVTPADLDVVA